MFGGATSPLSVAQHSQLKFHIVYVIRVTSSAEYWVRLKDRHELRLEIFQGRHLMFVASYFISELNLPIVSNVELHFRLKGFEGGFSSRDKG